MDAHIKKVYVPMTETGFYILLCLREESHGYSIVQQVKNLQMVRLTLAQGHCMEACPKWKKTGL